MSNIFTLGKSQLATDLGSGLKSLGHSVTSSTKDPPTKDSQIDAQNATTDFVIWVQDMPNKETPLLKQSEKDWERHCGTEIKAAINASRDFYESLKSNSGVLVFVIPNIGMGGAEGFAASAGASEAIRILGKGLAKLWGKDSIRVHSLALHPTHFLGAENSDLGKKLSSSMSLAEPALGDIGNPETDLAQILDLLIRDEASFLTGATLCADGGVWMA